MAIEIDEGRIESCRQLRKKYGDASVAVFRRIYGVHFAPHCTEGEKLKDVLDKLDVESLTHLTIDEKAGNLPRLVARFDHGR